MRERFLITVTDYRGSRHYSVGRIARRIGAAGLITLLLIVAGGAGVIAWLDHQISGLETRREALAADHRALVEERARLQAAIEAKNQELSRTSEKVEHLGDELGELEVMIGVREATAQINDLHQRMNIARQTAGEKLLMLQRVPSGWPVNGHEVTSDFGWRTHPIKGTRSHHNGVDLRGERGAPVRATADGVVEYAAFHSSSGLGKLVILRHDFGFRTYFGHMSEIAVQPGEFVAAGDVVGHVGSTGLSSGPHLHYEVRHIYRKLDPTPFLEWSLERYDSLFTREDDIQWESLASTVRRQIHRVAGLQSSQTAAASTEN